MGYVEISILVVVAVALLYTFYVIVSSYFKTPTPVVQDIAPVDVVETESAKNEIEVETPFPPPAEPAKKKRKTAAAKKAPKKTVNKRG